MRIYILRHGHKASQVPGYSGGFNAELSDKGHREAELLAEEMVEKDIDTLYSSSALRALQTTEPIHEKTSVEWNVWPVFCDGSRKTWKDVCESNPSKEKPGWRIGESIRAPTPAELREKHGNYYLLSDIPNKFDKAELTQPYEWPDAWWVPLDGETHIQSYARVAMGFEALKERHNDSDHIAVVCHSASGEMLFTEIMGYPWHRQRRIKLETAGIIRLDRLENGRWRVYNLNQTCHLQPEYEQRQQSQPR